MARIEKALIAAALSTLVLSASAQPRPDFSGRWMAVPDAPPTAPNTASPGASFGSGLGPDITITQTTATLTIERAQFSQYDMQPPIRFVYALDGSESRHRINVGRGLQDTASRITWQDGGLQLTTTSRVGGTGSGPMTTELRQVFTLDDADTLVVTATRSAAPGGQPAASRQVYKKK